MSSNTLIKKIAESNTIQIGKCKILINEQQNGVNVSGRLIIYKNGFTLDKSLAVEIKESTCKNHISIVTAAPLNIRLIKAKFNEIQCL